MKRITLPRLMRPIEEVARTPKRERLRLAKAELLLDIAIQTQKLAEGCGDRSTRHTPFAKWADHDPIRQIALAYGLSGKDLDKILTKIAGELEARAMRSGYEEAWI